MATNPYASIAIKDDENPYASIAIKPQLPATAPQQSILSKAGGVASDIGKGLGESVVSLMSTGDKAVRKIPGGIGEFLTTPANGTPADQAIAHTHQLATPANATALPPSSQRCGTRAARFSQRSAASTKSPAGASGVASA